MNQSTTPTPADHNLVGLARRTSVIVGVTLFLTILVVGLGYVFNVLMLLFAGLILAILLRAVTDFINRHTGIGDSASIALTVLLGIALIAGTFALLAPQVSSQIADLQKTLPQSWEKVSGQLEQSSWGRWALEKAPNPQQLVQKTNLFGQITGILSTTLGILGSFIVIVFLGLYLTVQPNLYLDGINRLVPIQKRDRTREVMLNIASNLRMWLFGKLIAMVFVGILVWLAMMFLDVRFALTLGVIAAIFTFIPNFGPIISGTPAVLLGFMQGPATALWVLAAFVAIQTLESYILTPMIQQKAVSMPPAMLLLSQLVLGMFVGVFGLALAAPLGLVVLLLVRSFYVHDLLGDKEAALKSS